MAYHTTTEPTLQDLLPVEQYVTTSIHGPLMLFSLGQYLVNTYLAPMILTSLQMIARWKDHLTYLSMWKPLCNFLLHLTALILQYLQ
jgi:hypothetical protein